MINVLLLSALYALVAIGFTMIFGIADILNLAHGAAIIVGGFAAFYTVDLGLNIWLAGLLAILLPAVFSLALYRILIEPVEHENTLVIITTLIVLTMVEEIFRNVAGTSSHVLPSLVSGGTSIAGVSIQYNRVVMFVVAWAAIVGLVLFIDRTWLGRAIKGVSMSTRGSVLVGVDNRRVVLATFGIAGALAGAAGLFLGISQGVSWDMGLEPLLIAFAIVVIGGMGSIKGSVVGAHIIGLVETLTTTYVDARLTGVSALVIMMFIIVARPNGLYGRPQEVGG
jgi:branched-chain amino acid transport system permease protein